MWLEHAAGGGAGVHEQVFKGVSETSFPPSCPSSVQSMHSAPRGPPWMDCILLPPDNKNPWRAGTPRPVRALPVLPVPAHSLARPRPGRCGLTNMKMMSKWEFWVRSLTPRG